MNRVIHVLDTFQLGRRGIVAATAVEIDGGLILLDTGPESTFGAVTAGLCQIGARPADVRHVFVSHIHFDHAGAAWRFAELGAKIHVHPRGAPHLTDPTKLVDSATRIFGDDMAKLWGRIAPVKVERVSVMNDNEVVRVGRLDVRAIATPGHASHHHVYLWEDNLFGGDVAGVRLGAGPTIPPFVPPELHVESWLDSIDRIRGANPAKLYLPHFGLVAGPVAEHLNELEERVRRWSSWLGDRLRARESEKQLIDAFGEYEAADLRGAGANESLIRDYETADPSFMAVGAVLRYWRKYHPEEFAQLPDAARTARIAQDRRQE